MAAVGALGHTPVSQETHPRCGPPALCPCYRHGRLSVRLPDFRQSGAHDPHEARLNVANNVNAQRVSLDTVCFHCQQAAEKYLKAVLVILDQEIPRIHDLEQLLDLVKEELPQLEGDREDLRWLTTCAVVSRYPVEVMATHQGQEDGHRAQAIAHHVRQSCHNSLRATDPDVLAAPKDSSDTAP